MVFSEYSSVNNILTIIDACQTDATIAFSFNLPVEFYDLSNPGNVKGLSIKKYLDSKFHFQLTQQNKQQLIKDIADNFVDGEICHYAFYKGSSKIGEGFDYCEINLLHPAYFKLTQAHLNSLDDAEINYMETE